MIEFKSKAENFISIQILRGIAAWLVVFHHYNQVFFSWDMTQSVLGSKLGFIFKDYGKLGVDVFFVISGFIIFLSIEKNRDVRRFILNRASRLIPNYWFFTFTMLFLSLIIPDSVLSGWTTESLVKSLFFIPNENPRLLGPYPYLTVGWTLNFEVLFYLLSALFLFILNKNWFIALILVLLFSSKFWNIDLASFFFNSKYIREFAWGMIIGWTFKNGLLPDNNKIGILFLIISMALFSYGGAQHLKIPAVTILVLSFLSFKPYIFNNLLGRVLKHLGDVSYSTYLAHAAISIPICIFIFGRTSSYNNEIYLIISYISITYLSSIFGYKIIENNFINKWIRNKNKQPIKSN